MLLIELEDVTVFARKTDDTFYTSRQMECEHITINTAAINSILDRYPNGCTIFLNGDFTREYETKESYATILAKIKDAEDDYYFRNYVIRPWEDKQEGKEHE